MTLPPAPDAQRMHAWLEDYRRDHARPGARAMACIGVVLGAWAVIALLSVIPVPQRWLQPGAWAVLAIVLAFYWYWKRSRVLAGALLAGFAALALLARGAGAVLGPDRFALVAAASLVAAAAIGFIGRRRAGRRGFPPDPVHWLIGPAWLMAGMLQRLGIRCP